VHGVAEELGQAGVEGVDVGVGPALLPELGGPAPHVGRLDHRHRDAPEVLPDELDVDLGLPDGRLAAGAVSVEPLVTPLADGDPCHLGCDVVAADKRCERIVEPLLCVDLPREVARVLLAGVVDVSGAPRGDGAGHRRGNLDGGAVLGRHGVHFVTAYSPACRTRLDARSLAAMHSCADERTSRQP
jgi:hypothetical protein